MKRLGLLLLLCCIIPLTAVCSDDDSGYGSDSSYPYYEPVDDLFSDSSTQSIDAQRTLFPTNAQKILREFDTEEKSLSEFLFNAFSREGLSLEETKQLLVMLIYDWVTADEAIHVPEPTEYTRNIERCTNHYQLNGWLLTRFSFILTNEFFELFYPTTAIVPMVPLQLSSTPCLDDAYESPDEQSYDQVLPTFTQDLICQMHRR